MLCISKILKNESNSQQLKLHGDKGWSCCVSQRYWKMKAIHNLSFIELYLLVVVVYLKDTEKWKQFTTQTNTKSTWRWLLCISKILKNESNSQRYTSTRRATSGCCVSQRYWKMKAIHNYLFAILASCAVVVYLKDTEKWKQFTT